MTEPAPKGPATAKKAEPVAEEWKIQISKKIAGDLWNFRARNAEDFKELTKGLAEHGDDIMNALGSFVTIAIARTVQTEEFNSSTRTQSAPAKQAVSKSEGGVPSCKHGPMKDLADKGYKHRWYCTSSDRKNQCAAVD